jgi:hypothetical protein
MGSLHPVPLKREGISVASLWEAKHTMSTRARRWWRVIIISGIAFYWIYFVIFDIVFFRPNHFYDLASNITIGFLGLIGAVSLWHQLGTDERKKAVEIRTTSTAERVTALSSASSQAAVSPEEHEEAAVTVKSLDKDRFGHRETIWFGIPRIGRISFITVFTLACGTGLWAVYLTLIYALSLTGVQFFRAFNNYVESGGSASLGTLNIYSFIFLTGYITAFVVSLYIWEKNIQ